MVFNPVTNLDYLIPKAWTVQEKTSTAWIRANINTDLGEVGLRGNIGVQMVRTDQSSQSNYFDRSRPDGQNILPIDDGKTYTDWLPSLNLAFMSETDWRRHSRSCTMAASERSSSSP